MREALDSLTPAERTQLMEARKKAMEAPELAEAKQKAEAARKESMDARKGALLKQDPSLGPILDKVQTPGGFKDLTPEERQKLQAARQALPEVEHKGSPAEKAFQEAMRAAMLKVDPTIGPVLDKVDAAMKAKREEHKDHEKKRE